MLPPSAKFKHKGRKVHAFGLRSKVLQLCAALLQKRPKPCWVAVRVVMKSCGHLDQTVQKSLATSPRFQPNGFERLVGLKELRRVKQPDSFFNAVLHRRLTLNERDSLT